jgi:hypothetical protein
MSVRHRWMLLLLSAALGAVPTTATSAAAAERMVRGSDATPPRIIPLPPPEPRPLRSDVQYEHWRSPDPLNSAHILRIARTNAALRPITTLAQRTIVGLETLSGQIRHIALGEGRPVAGVNGDFFIIKPGPYQGDPRGLQILSGELVSAAANTASFWVDPEGQPHLANVQSELHLHWPSGERTPLVLNQERTRSVTALYTPTFGDSTRTTNGMELVLAKTGSGPWLPIQPGVTYHARVLSVSRHNTPIRPDTMVLSFNPTGSSRAKRLPPGTLLDISTDTLPTLRGVQHAISGGPILVQSGQTQAWEPPQPRHPRTAIGWNATHFILAVVDGRLPGKSVGMSFPELAEFMRSLGCEEAVNLDGGGSSTLWLDGRVVNSPSDGHERSVANGLVWVIAE